jgi:hypothetical protein
MSFTDRLVLWLHVGFAVFTIGPVTVAIMSTPRYIRKHNLTIVGYLYRMTRIFTVASLGVLIFGLVAAQQQKDLAKPWLTVALTLFVVAIALLLLIMRDQHRAIGALQQAGPEGIAEAAVGRNLAAADSVEDSEAAEAAGELTPAGGGAADQGGAAATAPAAAATVAAAPAAAHLANVERGRITTMGGVVSLIWLVILVLMIWNS